MLSNVINAIILGVIEGITEFLPISSTGHLILVEDKLPLVGANSNTFMIAIQLGAIIAVIYLYPHVFKKSITPQHWFGAQNKRILLAISPALLCGFLAHSYIKTYLFSPKTVAMGLALGAILMLLSDYIIKRRPQTAHSNDIADISTKQAFIVGVCQCMALWPGMSRSASTIMGGIWSGLSYDLSARFSFIIAVPVMVAAVSYDLLKTAPSLTILDLQLIAIGFIVSFFVAIVAIKTFIQLLSKYKLAPFAVYRLVLVGLLILSGI